MVAKVGGVVIGLGLLGTGGVAIAKPGWFGISNMPAYTKLSEDHDFGTDGGSEYKDKFGGKNKENLVGVVGNKNVTDEKSSVEDWWKWSFEKLKVDKPQSKKFKYSGESSGDNAVTKPYAKDTNSDGNKALNQVCKAAYKSGVEKIKETPGASANDEYKEEDVWKYCSPKGKKPDTPST